MGREKEMTLWEALEALAVDAAGLVLLSLAGWWQWWEP